ncbi:MAG: hypothetical protein JSS02_31160 [Planctomycetes bacterium]|nr:hypothetical protein [Planctomycetota bacterium]
MSRQHQLRHSSRPAGVRRHNSATVPVTIRDRRPVAGFRHRGWQTTGTKLEDFNAPEQWHPTCESGHARYIVQPAGEGFRHAVTAEEVRNRLSQLDERFTRQLEVVQLSGMTRKRQLFPLYGMQWGTAVYLYPIEESLVEVYPRPPAPQQEIEARMYGGRWSYDGKLWRLTWTEATIKDFYLNNVLIHEIGHLNDHRNSNSRDRERYANWFAIEYGYRATQRTRQRAPIHSAR